MSIYTVGSDGVIALTSTSFIAPSNQWSLCNPRVQIVLAEVVSGGDLVARSR